MSAEIARRIRTVRFKPVRLGEAYSMDEVDQLLDLLETAAQAGEPLAPYFVGLDLPTARLREGYDVDEVDLFLGALRDGTQLPPEPQPKPGLLGRLLGRSDR